MKKRIKEVTKKILNYKKSASQWDDLFDVTFDKKEQEDDEKEPFKKKYAIAFTPRSGSTWLGDVLLKTNRMGKPMEWFNASFPGLKKRIAEYQSNSIEDYYCAIQNDKSSKNRVFGMEITWFQAQEVFNYIGNDTIFDDIEQWFWLRRKDFLAQGVSLFKAVESGKFHSVDKKDVTPIAYELN